MVSSICLIFSSATGAPGISSTLVDVAAAFVTMKPFGMSV
jgi:hypothetical protein